MKGQLMANQINQIKSLQDCESLAMSVSEFVRQTNESFKKQDPFILQGEISEIDIKKHVYLTIKDEKASLRCIIWQSIASRLPFQLTCGQKVIVQGRNNVYAPNGALSFHVQNIDLLGRGHIMDKLKRLEQRLDYEGVFGRPKYNRAPPLSRVGVITSLDGRVKDDIITNAHKRNPLLHILFFEAKVQGPGAAESLLKALHYAYTHYQEYQLDALIIGRGGGSFEDLLCFSDERVVRMVAMSPIPIISAVGHDEDRPLCDNAANWRVSTPTAAAEYVTPITLTKQSELADALKNTLDRLADNYASWKRTRYDNCCQRMRIMNIPGRPDVMRQRVNGLESRLQNLIDSCLDYYQQRVAFAEQGLNDNALRLRMMRYEQRLLSAQTVLDNFPHYVQSRYNQGYEALAQRLQMVEQRLLSYSLLLEQRLASVEQHLEYSLTPYVQNRANYLDWVEQKLVQIHQQLLYRRERLEARFNLLMSRLTSLNPLYQLDRGLSLTTKDGVHSIAGAEIQPGDILITFVKGYQVASQVTAIIIFR